MCVCVCVCVCWRTVAGRSIRHVGDYACIVLFDQRYAQARIQCKLPAWIARRLTTPSTWHEATSN
ncbi:hypothetical protein EON66_10390, partial [archaeon]